jgi:hypothetical protein
MRLHQSSQEETSPPYELRNINVIDLNEGSLFRALDAAISSTEDMQVTDGFKPFAQLAELLSLDPQHISTRLLERVSSYNLPSLKSAATLQSVIIGVETVLKHVIRTITACGDSFTLIYSGLRDRLISSQREHNSLAVIADSFMRSKNELDERKYFAILYQSTKDKAVLENALKEAQSKALVNQEFMQSAMPRHYYARVKMSTDGDADDDEEEEPEHEEASATATVKVTLTVSDQLRKKTRWIQSRQKLARALADWKNIAAGLDLEPKWNKPRVSLETIMNALKFLETLSVGWKGGATQSAAISDECKLANVPVLNVAMTAEAAWEVYLDTAKKDAKQHLWGAPRLGRDSFYSLYGGVCKIITDKHALSYYYTGMLTACDELKFYVTRIGELWTAHHSPGADKEHSSEFDSLGFTPDSLLLVIDSITEHAKYTLRTHVRLDDCDGIVMHCAKHAAGEGCSVPHSGGENYCKPCQNFAYLGDSVRRLMNAAANCLGREYDDTGLYSRDNKEGPVREILSTSAAITFCAKNLNLYHRHVIRGVIMNRAIAKVADTLPVGTVLVNLDHKQKIQPINFNESSEDYYGKKGISLLGFLVRWRSEDGGVLHTRYIDVVTSNGKQNAYQVQSLLGATMPLIKELIPTATTFTLVSDNGSAFSGGDNLRFCVGRNRSSWGCNLILDRWLFFEAQCGKTTLDTHFSFVNIVLRRFAREVRAVKNYRDVFEALKSHGGITNSVAVLAVFKENGATGDNDDEEGETGKKVEQVRKIHDIRFETDRVCSYHYADLNFGAQEHSFPSAPSEFISPVEIVDTATSAKIIDDAKKKIEIASTAAAVALTTTSATRPHHLRIGEALVTYSSTPTHAALPLLPAPALSVASAMDDPPAGGTKKKSAGMITSLSDDSGILKFQSNWASATSRPRVEMTPDIVAVVKTMVRSCLLSMSNLN